MKLYIGPDLVVGYHVAEIARDDRVMPYKVAGSPKIAT
jgi:hypothetical protein